MTTYKIGLNTSNQVPIVAVAFDDGAGNATLVSAATPLPGTGGGGGGGGTLADSLVIDAAGVYWIVRDNGLTLTYINLATGTTGSPTAPVTPMGKNRQTVTATYVAIVAGTGYSIGDVLQRLTVLDITTGTPVVLTSAWINLTTGAILGTPPTIGNLDLVDDNVKATLQAGSAVIGSISNTSFGISGTLPAFADIPTFNLGTIGGAATAALQTTGNTSLSAINAKFSSLGQKTSAASTPVVLASDQSTLPTNDQNGKGSVRYTTDTVAVTGGSFSQIMCLTATTFSVLTRTDATGSLVGVSLPAGTLLMGPFTAYTLTSGAVAAYN